MASDAGPRGACHGRTQGVARSRRWRGELGELGLCLGELGLARSRRWRGELGVLDRQIRIGEALVVLAKLEARLGAVAVELAEQVVVDAVRRVVLGRDLQRLRVPLDRLLMLTLLERRIALGLLLLHRHQRFDEREGRWRRLAVLLNHPVLLRRHLVFRLVGVKRPRRLPYDPALATRDALVREPKAVGRLGLLEDPPAVAHRLAVTDVSAQCAREHG